MCFEGSGCRRTVSLPRSRSKTPTPAALKVLNSNSDEGLTWLHESQKEQADSRQGGEKFMRLRCMTHMAGCRQEHFSISQHALH